MGDFLAGPAENHGVAGFQSHHAFPSLGELDHHGVDVFLPAAFAAAALSDEHALCLPPGEFEHV
ncbi:hypothetical protein D9M69_726090 [compost metagenome]